MYYIAFYKNELNHDQSFSHILTDMPKWTVYTNYTKLVKFHPKPKGFRAPFKRRTIWEFIQETRSWNNSLAVTDASQGKYGKIVNVMM